MFDHKRTDKWVPLALTAIATVVVCSSLLFAGTAFAGGGVSGPDFRAPFDFDQSGSSDVLLMKTSGSPNLGINETDIVSGTSFTARGWPDLNMSASGVEYTTLSAGVFADNGFEQAQILTRKVAGANQGLVRIVDLAASGIAPDTPPFQHFVGGTGTDWDFVGVGDCDGNGTDDIVFHNTSGGGSQGMIRIVFMNPNDFAVLATQHPGALGVNDVPIGVGDADGDGQADVWTHNTSTEAIGVLINAPDTATGGVFESGQLPTTLPADYKIAGIGIFNQADAQADIVFEKTANANIGLVRVDHTGDNGGATAAPARVWPTLLDDTLGETLVALGDYDGANQTDFLSRQFTPLVMANNGWLIVRLLDASGGDLAGMAGGPSWVNSLDFTVIAGSSVVP